MRSLAAVLFVLVIAACGGRQVAEPEGGELIRAEAAPSMMGDAERQARDLLDEMTLTLARNIGDRAEAVQRVEAFLRVNREALLDVASRLEARAAALEGGYRFVYEEQLSAWLSPSWRAWMDQVRALEAASSEDGLALRRALDVFEQNADRAATR
jgi:hypothetical protein